jgi:hypothetical protein
VNLFPHTEHTEALILHAVHLLANCGKRYGYTWLPSKPLGNVSYFCPSANKSPLQAECTVRPLSARASSVRNSMSEQVDELQNVSGLKAEIILHTSRYVQI